MPINGFVELIEQNQKEGMIVAELGVFDGETTQVYAPIVKKNNGKIIAIDWFEGNINAGPGPHVYAPSNKEAVIQRFRENLNSVGCLDIVEIIEKTTWEVANDIEDESIDIVFIDADHRYLSFLNDIEFYLPKVKEGGIISGHDCENLDFAGEFTPEELDLDWCESKRCHPGVIQAVYDVFGRDINFINEGGWKIWWKKKSN